MNREMHKLGNRKPEATASTNNRVEKPRLLGSLWARIFAGFAGISCVVIFSSLITIFRTANIERSMKSIENVRSPSTIQSKLVLVGINESLADLRGWMLLGEPRFQKSRQAIWPTRISPALAELSKLSNQWSDAEKQMLDGVHESAERLREFQEQIEKLVHTPENQPALQLMMDVAVPTAKQVTDLITSMIDEERTNEASPNRKLLLSDMADFRGSMALSISYARAYLASGDNRFNDLFSEQWRINNKAFNAITENQQLLTETQSADFQKLKTARSQFAPLPQKMIAIRSAPTWNQANYLLATKAAPEADKLTVALESIVEHQSQMMNIELEQNYKEHQRLRASQWLLMFFSLSACLIFGVLFSRWTSRPFKNAVTMANAISQGDLENRQPICGSYEAELLGNSLTQMADNLQSLFVELSESKERLARSVDGTSDGLWDWEISSDRVWYAPRFKELLGYANEDPAFPNTLDSFRNALHPDDIEATWEAIENHLSAKAEYDVQYRLRRKTGEYCWFRARGMASRNDQGIAVLMSGSIQDITELKRAEEKLIRRTSDLERSNAELEQFAYVASHDLQEPLRKVSSFCTLLAEEFGDRLGDEGKSYIDYAVDGALRMRTLVQDLLSYSRAGNREFKENEVNLNDVLKNVQWNLQTAIEESDATITCDDLPIVIGDKLQLTQLFQNLIGNAIKYRGEEPPEIHVGVDSTQNQWLYSVSDNGIGISPDYQEKVFGVFRRLHGRGKYSGTGIGLAICKRIVERMNGRIWIESEEGQGSRFCFTFPIQSPSHGIQDGTHESVVKSTSEIR